MTEKLQIDLEKLFYYIVLQAIDKEINEPYAIKMISHIVENNFDITTQDNYSQIMKMLKKKKMMILHGYLHILYTQTINSNKATEILTILKGRIEINLESVNNFFIEIVEPYVDLYFDQRFIGPLHLKTDNQKYQMLWESENYIEIMNRMKLFVTFDMGNLITRLCNIRKISYETIIGISYNDLVKYYIDCGNIIKNTIRRIHQILNSYIQSTKSIKKLLDFNQTYIDVFVELNELSVKKQLIENNVELKQQYINTVTSLEEIKENEKIDYDIENQEENEIENQEEIVCEIEEDIMQEIKELKENALHQEEIIKEMQLEENEENIKSKENIINELKIEFNEGIKELGDDIIELKEEITDLVENFIEDLEKETIKETENEINFIDCTDFEINIKIEN